MKAEDLVARCGARGLDLVGVAERETSTRPPRDVARMSRPSPVTGAPMVSLQLQESKTMRAFGAETRAMYESQWTVQELSLAASGVPPICFKAALFAWAGELRLYTELHDALFAYALRFSREQGWPIQVEGFDGHRRYYREHLCAMVLDEDSKPNLFALQVRPADGDQDDAPSIQAIYCEVSEKIWQDKLAGRYGQLQYVFWSWLNEAARTIQPRLREDESE